MKKATHTNMEEGKRDTEHSHSKQEKDSNHEWLLLLHGCGLEMKSLTRIRKPALTPVHICYFM